MALAGTRQNVDRRLLRGRHQACAFLRPRERASRTKRPVSPLPGPAALSASTTDQILKLRSVGPLSHVAGRTRKRPTYARYPAGVRSFRINPISPVWRERFSRSDARIVFTFAKHVSTSSLTST